MENGGQINRGGHLTGGRCDYFSSSEGGIFNLYRVRFDPSTGGTVGYSDPDYVIPQSSARDFTAPRQRRVERGPRAAGAADPHGFWQHLDARQSKRVMALQCSPRANVHSRYTRSFNRGRTEVRLTVRARSRLTTLMRVVTLESP